MATSIASKTTSDTVAQKSLREILDGLVVSQRQDIQAFSGGHLNEANLAKPPDRASHKSWKSATKPAIRMLQKSTLPSPPKHMHQQDSMKQTLVHFSTGTSGNAPMQPKPKPTPASPRASMLQSATSKTSDNMKKHRLSQTSDGVFIEELKLPEAMLKRTEYHDSKSKLTQRSYDGLRKDSARSLSSQTNTQEDQEQPTTPGRQHLLPLLKHQFMPSHFESVTKKDQFHHLKQFEVDVLRKQDTTEQNIMSGVKAVEHLEARLHEGLDNLQYNGYGPNFHRLQIYSNVFEDLIGESATFGFILETIKHEYDEYVASLLDGQLSRHKVLHNQVEQMYNRGPTNPDTLHQEINNVHMLEYDAKQLLEENDRLRKELQMEEELLNKPREEEEKHPKQHHQHYEEAPVDLTDQIQHLKSLILEKLDLMNELKIKMRMECVPSTVCSHLEQCIKETEVEIQKLSSQKDFFDRSIADMEQELQTAIETADTTEKDARRVWKRITAVKNVDRDHKPPGAGITKTGPGGPTHPQLDSDGEQDERDKWNWYIS